MSQLNVVDPLTVDRWKSNWFLIPRPNLLHLFLEADEDQIEITMGVKKEISPLVSKINPQPGELYYNRAIGCPVICSHNHIL